MTSGADENGTAQPCPGATVASPTGERTRQTGERTQQTLARTQQQAGEDGSTGTAAPLTGAEPTAAAGAAAVTRPAVPDRRLVAEGVGPAGPGTRLLLGENARPAAAGSPPAPAASADAAAATGEQPSHRRTRRGNRPGRRRGANGWQSADIRSSILIGAINIQSIKPKLPELNHELHELNKRRYDLLSVTETWLKPSTPSRLLSFPGYRVFRADRPDKSGYGGVIAVPPSANPASKIETLWLSVRSGRRDHRFVLAAVYRPPRRTVAALEADFETLERQLQHVMLKHPGTKIVINGDLNSNVLGNSSDSSRQALFNFLSVYSLSQVIDRPTFSTGSLLDVVIVNDRDVVKKSGTRVCDISPHKYVLAALCFARPRAKPTVVNCRPLKRVNINVDELHASLHQADWQAVYREGRCSDQWERFLSIFMPILDRYAPMRLVGIKNPDAPRVSEAAHDLMCRRRAARETRRDGDSGSADEYRSLNRAVKSAVRGTCGTALASALLSRARPLYTGMSARLSGAAGARELRRPLVQTT